MINRRMKDFYRQSERESEAAKIKRGKNEITESGQSDGKQKKVGEKKSKLKIPCPDARIFSRDFCMKTGIYIRRVLLI